MLFSLVALSCASLVAHASPLLPRQDVSSPIDSATSAIVSSVATAAGAVPSGSASASASSSVALENLYPAYPCPAGFDLTYVVQLMQYPGVPFQDGLGWLLGWSQVTPEPLINSTGTNETGATRTYSSSGVTLTEVLIRQTYEDGVLRSIWNSTAPVTYANPGVTIYRSQSQLDYYANETTGVTSAQLWANFCADNQGAGRTLYAALLPAILQRYGTTIVAAGSGGSSSASFNTESAIASPVPVPSRSASESASAPLTSAPSSSSAQSGLSEGVSTASGAFSAAPSPSQGASLTVNTPPSLLQCQPAAITFFGGSAPYFLSILPGGQPTATPLLQFPQQNQAGSYTWTVNIPAGTSITIRISDSTGVVNYSSPVTILQGTSNSCLSS